VHSEGAGDSDAAHLCGHDPGRARYDAFNLAEEVPRAVVADMTDVFAALVETLAAGLPQTMVNIYGMQRDGSVPEQLQRQSELKMEELERAHELRQEQESWKKSLRVDEHIEKLRAKDEIERSPFGKPPEVAHREVEQITLRGERPALLFAPFLNTRISMKENLENPSRYIHSLRSSWRESAWHAEMAADTGTIDKPLLRTDSDTRMIRKTLADLPVVLVCGVISETGRLRLEILAWNIVNDPAERIDSEPITITIPERATGVIGPEEELPDQLCLASTQLCAMLAEWFYVTRDGKHGGRLPGRHRDIDEGLRRATAAGTLVALRLAVDQRRLDPLTATVRQALVHADLGEVDALTDALGFLRRDNDRDRAEAELHALLDSFTGTGALSTCPPAQAGAVTKLLTDEYDRAAREFIESRL